MERLQLTVQEGEIFGLLGPNGAGKTTTVRILASLLAPSEGSASVAGFDVRRDSLKVRESVGILTENPCLYERLTALENMNFFAEAYGLDQPEKRDGRVRTLLDFFELWARRNDRVGTFSKGMKQKLAIARALVHDPPIVFLDEPTSGLDPESSKNVRDLVGSFSHREKHTTLLCTHRLEDAERLCNRVLIIKHGRGVAVGTIDELRRKIDGQPVLQITLRNMSDNILDVVKRHPAVTDASVDESTHRLLVRVDDYENAAPDIVRAVVDAGGLILSVEPLRPSLEDAYLKLVKEG